MLPSFSTPSRNEDAPPVLTVSLPLRFVASGLLSLFVGVVWLGFRPEILATYHYNQHVVALTHVFTLGWITSVIMGAMYQLVPVALETRLHSERLAKWQYVLHMIGLVGMVWMFWIWDMKQVGPLRFDHGARNWAVCL
jgi:cbb3-type cytochrome oxidase subunit 1